MSGTSRLIGWHDISKVIHVVVLKAVVVLEFPPIVVEILNVKRVHAVLQYAWRYSPDTVFIFQFLRIGVCVVDRFPAFEVKALVSEKAGRANRITNFDANDVEFHSAAYYHARLDMAHALKT